MDLIAGEYDEIGVGSVQLRIEQTERRLLRPGGVLRVGNDKDTEFPVFVKLQHGILLRGGDRRGKSPSAAAPRAPRKGTVGFYS